MSDFTHHINYTAADINNYLQGKMSNAERNAFEKAALADPFLADALEGFEIAETTKALQMLKETDNLISASALKQNKNYNLADIENYLQNNMGNAERNAFEKATLADPFLADALEGFENANLTEAKKYIGETATTILSKEVGKAKVVTMPIYKKQWLRIAAGFIIMIGAGATIWLLNNNTSTKKENTLAAITKEEIKQTPNTISALPTEKENTSEKIVNNHQQNASNKKEKVKIEDFNIINDNALISSPQAAIKTTESSAGIFSTEDALNKNKPKDISVKSMVGEPPAFPNNGAVNAQNSRNIEERNAIASNLAEASKSKKATAAVLKISDNEQNNKGITPIGGWKKFDDYINTKRAALHFTNELVESVIVTFLIDKEGKPYQIQAQSSIPEKSVRAIELIENGVNWQVKNTTNNKAVVIIKL
ncbi:MAG TPA: hypothetical protein PLU36_02560 [Chitinophagaceae bacterium]|nr:hypothetical protein [Chitinophagaceae bacterium]HMZ45664.1 hypothetical protein [Chitinophagaceae bacterium]HNF29701.1 hypothetical protein [Chitinophagaceae bacterium]HNN31766.1 hypothetical protein [Chitinophagaceae bacterium]